MNRIILGLLYALLLSAGCEWASNTTWDGPDAQCKPVSAACTGNAECCSYGCVAGVCTPGDVVGGVCKTTDDCGYAPGSYTQMLCKAGECSTTAICRDDGDTCSAYDYRPCCSGHCASSVCVPNDAPLANAGPDVVVPWHQPHTLANLTTDPNADPMTWGWTLDQKPALSAVTLSAAQQVARNPTFTPDVEGIYVFTLSANDGWITTQDSVAITAINTPPAVAGATDVAAASRGNPVTLSPSVSDPDGDAVTCYWTLVDPGGAETTPVAAAPCGGAFPLTFTPGPALSAEGTWIATLHATDGNTPVTEDVSVTVVNDPPVVSAPATRTFNLGPDAAGTPLATITATHADVNGDAIATWSWELLSAPAASALTTGSLTAADTATVAFKPDVIGPYSLRVTGCDRPGSCGQATVMATVYPYVRQLGHAVTDAAFARGASLARLVLVGPDSTTGALWDYDLLAGGAPVKSTFPEAPNAVTLTPDGGTAVVGGNVNAYKVVLGASPTLTTYAAAASIGDVVTVSGTDAYVFPKTPGFGVYVRRLDLASGAWAATTVYGTWGTSLPTVSNKFFAADTYNTDLRRVRLQGSNEVVETTDASYTCGKVWSTGNGAYVVDDCGEVYVAASGDLVTPLAPVTTIGYTAIHSVDSAPDGTVVLVVPDAAQAVVRYTSAFTYLSSHLLPRWGDGGADRGVEGLFAFVSQDGATAYVVVRTTSAPIEYGLYAYAIP